MQWIRGLLLAFCIAVAGRINSACTVFVLTDAKSTLFCNNEDWLNPVTRLWFVPGGSNYFGCVFVGFDNGWAQGGMNSEGLAFDWVAGGNFDYSPGTKLAGVRGNSSQRMLESCKTVEEAIAFYEKHREASFSRARIMVADQTGASVIISAREGKVFAERSKTCHGFGYCGQRVEAEMARMPKPTVAKGIEILRECAQEGPYATKYSNIFDLKKGDIHLFRPGRKDAVTLNFRRELEKGGHFYDIPKLSEQVKKAARPLLKNMNRMPLDAYRVIADHSPEITKRIRGILEGAGSAPLREADFAPEYWKQIGAEEGSMRGQLRALGTLRQIERVETDPGDSARNHRFRIDFDYATVLVGYLLDEENRIAAIVTDDVEQKGR